MTWGEQNTKAQAHQQLDYAIERGINFIDTAELYPAMPRQETQGRTESFIGDWFDKGNRDKVVLASKITGPSVNLPWIRNGKTRFTEPVITQALHDSLKRLQTDYIDLYQLHWPDRPTNYFGQLGYRHQEDPEATPLHETLAALKTHIDAGKIRAVGLSNESPWGVMKFLEIAQYHELPHMVTVQNPYNLLNRAFEIGHAEICHREDIGLLAYSPLAFGVLTGKYLANPWPTHTRLALFKHFHRYSTPEATEAVTYYQEIARRYTLSLTQMALAFINSRGFLTSTIIGATSLEQLEENIDTLAITLDKTCLREIEKVHLKNSNPCP